MRGDVGCDARNCRKTDGDHRHVRCVQWQPMALPFSLVDTTRPGKSSNAPPADLGQASHDPRALRILAKTIYRELRQGGLQEEDVMSLAGELLALVTTEVKDRRQTSPRTG
jgi:hypothetical protein